MTPTLAELVAQARWPRRSIALALAPHREELLRLRREGASVEALAAGLRGLDVRVSDESLRLWLNQKLGHKPARRRKPRFRRSIVAPVATAPAVATPPVQAPTPAALEANAPAAVFPKELSPAHVPLEKGTSFIRPGETPYQALQRRLAVLNAEKTAAKAAGVEKPRGRIARDDI